MPKTIFDKGQNTKYFKYKTEFLDQLYHLMEIVIMDPNYSPKIIQEISFELIYVQFKELVDIEEYFT